MPLQNISPEKARKMIDQGAMLVDIRDPDEYAREHIAAARSLPVSDLPDQIGAGSPAGQIIFHCRSGGRTNTHAARLARAANCEAFILEGGLDAWKKAGLPVERDRSQPLEMMRQVQLAAGGMVVLGVVLGASATPWFYLLSGFVGAGLMFAGATGTCGLAMLLQRMPWNRCAVDIRQS
jgi:rhodanese-related sulfurtransferase